MHSFRPQHRFFRESKSWNAERILLVFGVTKSMLKRNDYFAIDTMFPFLSAFIYRLTGCIENPALTSICTTCSDILNLFIYFSCDTTTTKMHMETLKEKISMLKKKSKETFGDLGGISPFTLKLYMLDHVIEDVELFGDLSYVDASAYEHIKFHNQNVHQNDID